MVRSRHYIEADVYQEAKHRLHHIFDLFDTVVVSFSGGKDSTCCLELTWEVAQERGLDRVPVVFRDEELVPSAVLDYVDTYRHKPWVDMTWFAVPLQSSKFILGATLDYVQWDPDREWVRPKPDWAETLDDTREVFSQYAMDDLVASMFRGKVAIVTGVRAGESITRYRACVNKLNENYMTASPSKSAMLCKPIFDWMENDVFRYLWELEQDGRQPLLRQYDDQLMAGGRLRVSTPLSSEPAKDVERNLTMVAPDLYDRIVQVFPEFRVQDRYWSDIDRDADMERWGNSFEGIREWIDHALADDPRQHQIAVTEYDRVMRIVHHQGAHRFPPRYLFRQFQNGAYKRKIIPASKAEADKFEETA